MRLFEFQGKELFKKYGIPIPRSVLVRDTTELSAAYDRLPHPVVIKAQVLAGGRGKAGGVVVVNSLEEAEQATKGMLSGTMTIGGERPTGVLVEEASPHVEEMYVSISLDRGKRTFVAIASRAGGIEVESLSGKAIEPVPLSGLTPESARQMASKLNLTGRTSDEFQRILLDLERLSREEECELVEVNPLAVNQGGAVVALDSKLVLDDNALFRHPEFSQLPPEDPLEGEASKEGFAFVRLEGDVAVVGNGAGLVLSTLDLVASAGGRAACFLDLGGGAQKDRVEAALRLVRKLPTARIILVNIFGGITRTTDVAAGLKEVLDEWGSTGSPPVYARISGAEEDEAHAMLAQTAAKIFPTAQEAVTAAVGGA